MKQTVLALTTALLLAGAMASTASAQQIYYEYSNRPVIYADRDYDRDGIPSRFDSNDYRYDRYGNRIYFNRMISDRDCDGVPDDRDYHDRRNVRDRDCDGIPNRYDSYDDRVYTRGQRYVAPRYVAPRGYAYARWDVGSYLPVGYYGSSYYIDYRPYGLSAPPYGYRWNRVGNDVYLISTRNGLIAEVIYNLFR